MSLFIKQRIFKYVRVHTFHMFICKVKISFENIRLEMEKVCY